MEAHVLRVAHPKADELAREPVAAERRVGGLFAGTGLALFAAMGASPRRTSWPSPRAGSTA
jgi:hypothetical protein